MHPAISKEIIQKETFNQRRYGYGKYPCFGIYHRPQHEQPKVAFLTSHYTADWSEHYLAEYMAARGFGYLTWNTRFQGAPSPTGFAIDLALMDIGVAIRWLREEAGVEKIVLLGNSGGASLLGAYQAQAVSPHITPGTVPPELFEALDPADAYISLAAHPGRARILTEWLDPSVTDESDPLSRDPELDMFNPEFGPPYEPEFVDRYRKAQVARNERITLWAEAELERIRDGRPTGGAQLKGEDAFGTVSTDGVYDRFFMLPRLFADLRFLDLTLDPSKREVGCYAGDPLQANYSGYGHPPITSAREWLSMLSLSRTQISLDKQLPRITDPALVIYFNHDQGCYPSHAKEAFAALGSADKQIVALDGGHYCEGVGDREGLADLIGNWARDKVGEPG